MVFGVVVVDGGLATISLLKEFPPIIEHLCVSVKIAKVKKKCEYCFDVLETVPAVVPVQTQRFIEADPI